MLLDRGMCTWRVTSQAVDGRMGLGETGFNKVVEGGVSMMMKKATAISQEISTTWIEIGNKAKETAKPLKEKIAHILEREEDMEKAKDEALKIVETKEAGIVYLNFRKFEQQELKVSMCRAEIGTLKAKHTCQGAAFDAIFKVLPAEEHPEDMASIVGSVVGNLTAFQALHRTLKVGETRASLAARCLKGIAKKMLLSVDPNIAMALKSLVGAKEAPPAISASPDGDGATVSSSSSSARTGA